MKRRAGAWLAAGAGAAALVAVSVVATLQYDGRSEIDLRGFVRPDAGTSVFLPEGRDATSELCGAGDCVQAVDSATAVLRKYSSQAEARTAAARLGDTHLSGWIVVE